tara:strand:+ start:567 stop:1103 length:537 start_codon:yes stop_codon:yes gene_type:complete
LRRIARKETDERRIVKLLEPHIMRLARTISTTPGWIQDEHYECDPNQGFGLHLLHEEEDHSLPVFLFSWLPGRGTPAHNHKTWGVVVGLDGEESEFLRERLDDGSKPGFADLKRVGERKLTVDTMSSFLGDDIHTVRNDGERTTLSLHTYGMHINYTGRTRFDPELKTASDYVVTVKD